MPVAFQSPQRPMRGMGSRYRSGRSPDRLKFKNPEAPAVRREAERSPIREHGADAAKRAVKARRPAESG
jgi:hypothetical protein